MNKCQHIIQ